MKENYAVVAFRSEIASVLGVTECCVNIEAARFMEKAGNARIIATHHNDHDKYEEIQLEHMPTMISLGLREFDVEKSVARSMKQAWIVSDFTNESSYRIINYPRSGSTWLRLMLTFVAIWNWDRGTKHAAALHKNSEVSELIRWAPYVVPHLYSKEARSNEGSPFPRFHPTLYRSHRNTFTDRHKKVVYVLRDGRAATASFFALSNRRKQPQHFTSIAKFLEKDVSIPGGGWAYHVNQWLIQNKHPNLLVVRYEDMMTSPHEELLKVCAFVGLNAPQYILDRAVASTDIDRVRSAWHDKKEKSFVGRGSVAGWESAFHPKDKELFKKEGQPALEKLGYAENDSW